MFCRPVRILMEYIYIPINAEISAFGCNLPIGRNLLSIKKNRITCKFQEATIIVRVESESGSKTLLPPHPTSRIRNVRVFYNGQWHSIYLGFPSTVLYSGKRNLCRTRRMTRHVATLPYMMADLFAVYERSS